jgi:hypothetical protein
MVHFFFSYNFFFFFFINSFPAYLFLGTWMSEQTSI